MNAYISAKCNKICNKNLFMKRKNSLVALNRHGIFT